MDSLLTGSLVPEDNYSLYHPSIFQNPAKDMEMLDTTVAHKTGPDAMWKNDQIQAHKKMYNYGAKDPKDPPLTKAEIEAICDKIEMIHTASINNTIPTLLYRLFFSVPNMAVLQKNIKYSVFKNNGYQIGDQSEIELIRIMEDVYDQYAENAEELYIPSKALFRFNYAQIIKLNKLVVNIAVPFIIEQITQHMAYMELVKTPMSPTSLRRPESTNITGLRQYRSAVGDILAPTPVNIQTMYVSTSF